MTAEQKKFIENIAKCVNKLKCNYGIKVASPIIAQAIIESNWGKSGLAKYYNYFGLKCGSCWKGASVNMNTKEEYKAGVLTNISANFRAYSSMEEGVKGYFDFINTKRYANLKGVTDPKEYLKKIKEDGYATDSKYVSKMLTCITNYGLKVYDAEVAPVQPCTNRVIATVQDWLNQTQSARLIKNELCGYKKLDTDGVFGEKTKAALTISLQVWLNIFGVNLKIDGVFGEKTKKACRVVSEKCNANTKGAQIVQAILYCYGFNPQLWDESWSKDCTAAVKQFQEDRGLEVDGIAGAKFFESALK